MSRDDLGSDLKPSCHALLSSIKKLWVVVATDTIAALAAGSSDEHFYAAAFHMFYMDYLVIRPPSLAVNTEQWIDKDNAGEDRHSHDRWSPPEWRWDVVDGAFHSMQEHYERLSNEMAQADDPQWETLAVLHDQLMVEASLSATQEIRSNAESKGMKQVSKDFIVVVLDGRHDHYEEMLRASLGPERQPLASQILAE